MLCVVVELFEDYFTNFLIQVEISGRHGNELLCVVHIQLVLSQ